MKQLTEQEAIALAESDIWKKWSDNEVVRFQLYQDRLCMDFSRFHEAMEAVLGRPVWTHEFADWKRLQQEYESERESATLQEIMNMIPEEKRIVVVLPKEQMGD